jgi:Polysaccharide lyase
MERHPLLRALLAALVLTAACSSGDHGTTGSTGGAGATSSTSTTSTTSATSTTSPTSTTSATSGTGGAGGGGFAGNASPICMPVAVDGDMTKGPFAAPPAAGAGVSFLTDWPLLPTSGGYRYTQIMDACRMQLDGTHTWHGLPALRVEVDPGDDPLGLGSERAEALDMQDASGILYENGTSGTQYYATSYLFPASWDGTALQGDAESWSFVFQVYGATALSAARHSAGGQQIYELSVGPPGGNDQSFSFTDSAIALGQWTDLVFMVTWATAATGHITAWRRDQGQAQFQQVLDVGSLVTLPTADATSYYWKQGLYRGPDVSGRSDVLWIGPSARGASFAAVETAAFGTADGP